MKLTTHFHNSVAFMLAVISIVGMMIPEFERFFGLFLLIPVTVVFAGSLPRAYWKALLPAAIVIMLIGILSFHRELTFGNVIIRLAAWQMTLPYPVVAAARPVAGFCLVILMLTAAVRLRSARRLLDIAAFTGLIIAVIALTAVAWTTKSSVFLPIITLMPRIDYPILGNNINVNEIGGALAWFTPLLIAALFYEWGMITGQNGKPRSDKRRWMVTIGSLLSVSALMLGQSRFAIAGVIAAVIVLSLLLLRGRRRLIALGITTLFIAAEIVILSNILVPADLSTLERDQDSVSSRLLIWESAIAIIRDYPLTGAGINAFRAPLVRARYPVEGYEVRVLPHAHNELLQAGADLGLPGIAALLLLYVSTGWTAWRVWKQGDLLHRVIAIGALAGLGAHFFYGIGDAITLWDRLSFGFWLLLGLVIAAAAPSSQPESVRLGYTPQD